MAIQNSTQFAAQVAIPPVYDDAVNIYGKLRLLRFNFTQVGTGTIADQARLIRLPAGKVSVLGPLCRLRNSAWTAATTLNLGFEAYRDRLGNTVSANLTAFLSALAINAAADTTTGFLPTFPSDGITQFESGNGVIVTGTINGAAPLAGATLNGFLVIAVE